MSEWQPIETAPDDGTEILVTVRYNIGADEYASSTWVDSIMPDGSWFIYPERIDLPFPPSHWMPLPDPPK